MASPTTLPSPSSDARFWSVLRGRTDTLVEEGRRRKPLDSSPASSDAVESEPRKRLREDSLLLIRGFDSVSSSLAQLNDILNAAAEGARDLAKPSLTEVLTRESQTLRSSQCDQPERKKLCRSTNEFVVGERTLLVETDQVRQCPPDPATKDQERKEKEADEEKQHNDDDDCKQETRHKKLDKAKKLAISMAARATTLAGELRKLKSELGFVQERCALLEVENRQLRDGFEQGLRPDEDDLVRLQLEALLAEKSRLANENATLKRENECLQQLVEYHQLASLQEDMSPESYERAMLMQGTCLDFSPFATTCSDLDEDDDDRCYGEVVEEEAAGPHDIACASQNLGDQFEMAKACPGEQEGA